MGVYTTTEDVAFNELIELHNKTTETEIKRITGNAIAMIQGKNGYIWELLCEIDSLEDGIKEQEAVEPKKDCELNDLNMMINVYYCGNCGEKITGTFCSRCGRAVKWK